MLVDGRGVPLAAAVDGANVHDQKLLAPTLDGIPVERPEPVPYNPQHLCLDKGYVGKPVEQEVRKRGYIPHLPVKGGERSRDTIVTAKLGAGKSNGRTRG